MAIDTIVSATSDSVVDDTPGVIAGGTQTPPVTDPKATPDQKPVDPKAADAAKSSDSAAWPSDWREKMAQNASAGDAKKYDKELKRLQRFADPSGIYASARELEARFTGGGLVKVPGKDAKPEEVKAFHQSLGVPEKPEEYFKDLKLDNGAIIGEADKPLADSFAAALHPTGARPETVNAALNWYYKQQEEAAAALDQADDDFKREANRALKEEWGPAFTRRANAISSLFVKAEGGADLKNDESVYARLLGGRTADGKLIGNDPAILKWLDGLRHEVNPAATLVDDTADTSQSINDAIKQIETVMRTDRKAYNKDTAMQQRYVELLAAREKMSAKKA